MSRFRMGVPIFFMFVLCIGVKVEADPFSGCMEIIHLQSGLDSFIKLAAEEQLNVSCANVTSFTTCMNDVVRNQTGFDVKVLANLLKGTDAGKALNLFINMTDLIEEMCTEGNQLREDYLLDAHCLQDINIDMLKQCQEQAANASVIFRHLQTEGIGEQTLNERCVNAAYTLGCLGVVVLEECGERAFNTYKEVVKRTGYFQSGICSPDLLQTVNTTIIDSLEMLESRKSVYRIIFDLKKRRK